MVVVAHCASAHGDGARNFAFNAIFLVHVQDEADIRLRSGDARDGPKMPSLKFKCDPSAISNAAL